MAQIMEDSDRQSASVSRCGVIYLACTREAWLVHWLWVRDCFLTGCAAPRPVPVQLQLYAGTGKGESGGLGERGGAWGANNFYTEKQCHAMSHLNKQVKQ